MLRGFFSTESPSFCGSGWSPSLSEPESSERGRSPIAPEALLESPMGIVDKYTQIIIEKEGFLRSKAQYVR